jgi:pyruvate/2-oxoglutarate dehydrogenase complex dihydrolipoamide dehydrogenase (E3) component
MLFIKYALLLLSPPSESLHLTFLPSITPQGVSGLLSVITGKWLGKKCALIERHSMGGDCLNIGCVPSKAVISAANAFRKVKEVSKFGISLPGGGEATIDFGFVMERMRKIRAEISHHDSVARYAKDFCEHVYVGQGVFAPAEEGRVVTVMGDDGTMRQLRYKKAMIATGASAFIPPVLCDIPHLTNANFFNLTKLPPRMVVIGSGPIGLELAQSMSVFGCDVTCLERGAQVLVREDPDAARVLSAQLEKDGVTVMCHASVVSIELVNRETEYSLFNGPFPLYNVTICNTSTGTERVVQCDAILNATGRVPNVFNLGLEHVGVLFDSRVGVHINEHFKTDNKDIYSCGDCSTAYKFTHAADFQARLAVRNMYLGDANRLSDMLVPWCTYTFPEIAHVGKYEAELDRDGVQYESFVRQLSPVDRCLCDGVEAGFVKLTVLGGSDKIIGATICGEHAGDMISELTVCMQHGIGIAQVAGTIHPYPTIQEAIRQCALGFYKHYKDSSGLPLAALKLLMAEVEEKGH